MLLPFSMLFALALLTAVAALAAYHAPISFMKPGVLRVIAQLVAVVLALVLGSTVAAWGPRSAAGLSFHQMVVISILVLGFALRFYLKKKQ